MNVIYIDVLIILNLYVTYFLIKAACVFIHKKIRVLRIVLGSIFGGISSLVILFPVLPLPVNILIKIILGLIIVLICFGFYNLKRYLRYSLIFIIINLLFAGMMMIVWLFSAPIGMFYNNGTFYFDISFTAITVSTAFAYGIIKLLRYILDSRMGTDKTYKVTVKYNNSQTVFNAFPDTGNTLTDFFTGLPVIICDKSVFKSIIPDGISIEKLYNEPVKGIRLLPYSTVGSPGLLPVFKPEHIIIDDSNGVKKSVNALVGISESEIRRDEVNAIFNPKLLL